MSSEPSILAHPFSRGIYYLLLSTIPFYRLRHGFPLLPLDWYLAMVLLIIMGIHLVMTKRLPPNFFNRLNLWFLLFLGVNFVSSLLSSYSSFAFSQMFTLVQAYIFIAINLSFLDDRVIFYRLPLVLGLSIGINSLIASLGYFAGMTYLNTWEGQFVTTGLTLGANSLSLMCVFVLPLMIFCMVNAETGRAFLLYLSLVVVNIGGLISSESRGGFLNFFIMAFMLMIANRQRFQPRFFGLVISGFALAVVLVGGAVPDEYFERQKTLISDTQDTSLQRRAAYLRVGLRSFLEHPLLGAGTGTFPKIWVNSKETRFFKMVERRTHNVYLHVLVGTGLTGLLIFFGLLFRVVGDFIAGIRYLHIPGREYEKNMAMAYMIAFLSLCSYGLVKNLLDHKLFILILPVSQVLFFYSRGIWQAAAADPG